MKLIKFALISVFLLHTLIPIIFSEIRVFIKPIIVGVLVMSCFRADGRVFWKIPGIRFVTYIPNQLEKISIKQIIEMIVLIYSIKLIHKFYSFIIFNIFSGILNKFNSITFFIFNYFSNLVLKFPISLICIFPLLRKFGSFYLLGYVLLFGGFCLFLVSSIMTICSFLWKYLMHNENPKTSKQNLKNANA